MSETLIEKYIAENGEMVITPVGVSMWPMLRYRRDTVYIVKPEGRLKKYDLPVYKRTDGKLVMHRVIEVHPDSYTMCGDHQTVLEPGIKDSQIIAVVKGFYRDEKYIPVEDKRYIKYYKFWCADFNRRKRILAVLDLKTKIKSCVYKLLKKAGIKRPGRHN